MDPEIIRISLDSVWPWFHSAAILLSSPASTLSFSSLFSLMTFKFKLANTDVHHLELSTLQKKIK
jgi:hypothetical protein